MLLSTFTRILTAIAVGMATSTTGTTVHAAETESKYMDKDIYMKHVSLHALERINTFRAAHDHLSEAQAAALDLLENVVRTFDINSVQDAEDACIAAFGEDECRYFSAQPISARDDHVGEGNNLVARAADCKCATLNNWCSSGQKCISHKTKACNYASYGCGTVWIYPCDGRCAEGGGGGGWKK